MQLRGIAEQARPLSRRPCSTFPAPQTALARVGEGNTVCDYDPEEIRRKTTVSAAIAPLEWRNHKINLLDAPGLFDFEGAMCEAVRAADSVLIAVSGKDGVNVGTEKAVAAADARGLAKIFFVNGLCDESARFFIACSRT